MNGIQQCDLAKIYVNERRAESEAWNLASEVEQANKANQKPKPVQMQWVIRMAANLQTLVASLLA